MTANQLMLTVGHDRVYSCRIIRYVMASGDREFCAPAVTRELSPMTDVAISDTRASESPAPNYCDPKITGAVEEAFNAVWAIIKTNKQAGSEDEPDCELRVKVSQTLAELVVEGTTDPAELKRRALASLGWSTSEK